MINNKQIVGTRPFTKDIYAIDYSASGKVVIAIDWSAKVYLLDGESLKELDVF
jgi:hypothetical protein